MPDQKPATTRNEEFVPEANRIVRCRYQPDGSNPCTAEAVEAMGEIIMCAGHLAAALELLKRRMPFPAIRRLVAPTR